MAKTKTLLTERQAHSIAEFLRVMNNAKRIEMLCVLMQREMCVEELAESVGLSLVAVYQHLMRLNIFRLLSNRKISATTYYKLCPKAVRRIQTFQRLLEQAREINLLSAR